MRLERNALEHVHTAFALTEKTVQIFAAKREIARGRSHFYRAVPRMTSPGSRRAARYAGIRLAIMTMITAVTVAST